MPVRLLHRKGSGGKKLGIWRVPAAGGPPRLTVSFDDPSRYVMRPWLEVNGNRMCFTRADPQSDVWMTEVSGAR